MSLWMPVGRTVRAAWWLAGALAVGAPQAASVNAPIDQPGAAPGGGAATAGGRVLDKALTGEVSTGSQNLDMLLEMHRSDAAAADRPAADGSTPTPRNATARTTAESAKALGAAPVQPAAAPAPTPQGVTPGLSREGLLGSGDTGLGGGAAPRSDRPPARRDWSGNTSSAGGGPGLGGDGSAGSGSGGAEGRAPGPWFDWPRALIEFVRSHGLDLLGGALLLLLVLTGGRALLRRLDRRPGRPPGRPR